MFRPTDVGQIFGQDHLQELLISWFEDTTQIPQSLLLSGPYGVGKTSIARMVASRITTLSEDLSEINAADARGIDDVRAWIESARFSPFGSGGKVYIIDELHQMTNTAQSALLKVIEEPPKGIYFFLCTTSPSKLLPTIRSRCTNLELKLFKPQDTIDLLSFVFRNKLSLEVKEAIHMKTGGHARDAVKMGETAILMGASTVQELHGEVGLGYSDIEKILMDAIAVTDQTSGLKELYLESADAISKVHDGAVLASVLDDVIDRAVVSQHLCVCRIYKDLLELKALRSEWKITPQQHALYFLSQTIRY